MDIVRLYAAGEVRRWHHNPAMARFGQTIADHQGRCVQLLLVLNPLASPFLIRAVAFHDVGELDAGDLSGPFKREWPEIMALHGGAERVAREALVGPDPYLTEEEGLWLKLVDGLEAAAYVLLVNPGEADRRGWPGAKDAILSLARTLGVVDAVEDLLASLDRGDW